MNQTYIYKETILLLYIVVKNLSGYFVAQRDWHDHQWNAEILLQKKKPDMVRLQIIQLSFLLPNRSRKTKGNWKESQIFLQEVKTVPEIFVLT